MSAILPDCAICGSRVVALLDGLAIVEECAGCGTAQRPITPPVDVRDLREQITTVMEARPVLCEPCVTKRCTACVTADCDCPRQRHPQRPVGDITAEGLALLATERQGHLDAAELPGGARAPR